MPDRLNFFFHGHKKPFLPLLSAAVLLLLYFRCNFQIKSFIREMALSLQLFPGIVTGGKQSFAKSSAPSLSVTFANPRTVRIVTLAASSDQATETKKPTGRGIMKPRRVSPEMQAFLGGVSEIPRTQVLKEIWAYIKENNLQVLICEPDIRCMCMNYESFCSPFLVFFYYCDWLSLTQHNISIFSYIRIY